MPITLLALETATDVCSVALTQDTRVLFETTLTRPRAHAENLAPMMQDTLRYAGLAASDLDAVAVSAGPGSYTGLRIGVSTAKGLAVATGARLIAVPSLQALASSVAPMTAPGDGVCALFNSRRNEVYAAFFLVDEDTLGDAVKVAALQVDELPEWLGEIEARLWLVGEGVSRVLTTLETASEHNLYPLDPKQYAPSAAQVARLAQSRYEQGLFEDVATFEPSYLKSFVAKKPSGSIFEKLPF